MTTELEALGVRMRRFASQAAAAAAEAPPHTPSPPLAAALLLAAATTIMPASSAEDDGGDAEDKARAVRASEAMYGGIAGAFAAAEAAGARAAATGADAAACRDEERARTAPPPWRTQADCGDGAVRFYHSPIPPLLEPPIARSTAACRGGAQKAGRQGSAGPPRTDELT